MPVGKALAAALLYFALVFGAGFLLGLKTTRPAKQIQAELLAQDILAGTSADPNVLRLLQAFTLSAAHVEMLRDALAKLPA